MDIIPLINLKKRNMVQNREDSQQSFNELLEQIDKEDEIYILDTDGIEKDKPNLCLYQKISEQRKIWADGGPRVLGDVVDAVMAGATKITLRKNLWPNLDISSIKEITECEVYFNIDLNTLNKFNMGTYLPYNIDGLVIFHNKNQIESDFKSVSYLKNLCTKYKIFAYESELENLYYWKTLGITGLLVDIDRVREFKKDGF